MLYAKVDAEGRVVKWPLQESDVRAMFPSVSLPEVITEEAVIGLGIVLVPPSKIPDGMVETQNAKLRLSSTLTLVDGKYSRQYELAPVPESEVPERIRRQWIMVRKRRDSMMAGFQWRIARYERQVRMGVVPMDSITALDAYMQALADVTLQPDPFKIVWPQLPE